MVMLFTEVIRQEEKHFEEQRSCLPLTTHRILLSMSFTWLSITISLGLLHTFLSPSLQQENNWLVPKFMFVPTLVHSTDVDTYLVFSQLHY